MNDGIDLAVAFGIGALVGLGELVGRYRDEPGRAVRSQPAYIYMAVNGAASLAALGLAHIFGWTFGSASGSDQARATQVVVAGFGAMAVFRSSLFIYRVGNKDVGIGPVAFLQVVLDATDRGVDRHRARARSEWVRRVMFKLEFKEVAISLPAYAIGLMQNLSQQDQDVLYTRVDGIRTSRQDEPMKAMMLGLLVMDAVGEEVLEEAVLTVRKELGLEEPPASGGLGTIANIVSRRLTTRETTQAGSGAPPSGVAPADASGVAPADASGVAPADASGVAPADAGRAARLSVSDSPVGVLAIPPESSAADD